MTTQQVPVSVSQSTSDDMTVTGSNGEVTHLAEQTATRVVSKALVTQVPKMVAAIAQQVVQQNDARRQAVEDRRADRRNRNRSLTLVVALMFTFLVPYIVANVMHDVALLKYATGIAIFPDALITLYAYIKRY